MGSDPLVEARKTATARAHSNIAFVKYWGNRDHSLRLPANSSISMNLSALHTTTIVDWNRRLDADLLTINGKAAGEGALRRVREHLDVLRRRFGMDAFASVASRNNFPMGTGIASSASAFAALTVAAAAAARFELTEREMSALARLGSGSAARSVPAGYVEWLAGSSHETSFAEAFAPPQHWDLVDVIAIVSREHKHVGSSAGHKTAASSALQPARVASTRARIDAVKQSIMRRDFDRFASIVEEDSNLMHAVMMTSRPPLLYWEPLSLMIMKAVRRWRQQEGKAVCYTLDAGPNVHCICLASDADAVSGRLLALSEGIEVMQSGVGAGAGVMPPA
ncbi:MAG: diphosphomevalonate decarboxylase [Chloroflexota bacterium]|nr:diphosphomevalonate decarboxylase [Chloroflexota bacterium]